MTLEQEIFSWESRLLEIDIFIYYNCVLQVPVGNFPIGTKFSRAIINRGEFDIPTLTLINHDERGFIFRLAYQVKEQLA